MAREACKQTVYKLNGLTEQDMARLSLGLGLLIRDCEKRAVSPEVLTDTTHLKDFIDSIRTD